MSFASAATCVFALPGMADSSIESSSARRRGAEEAYCVRCDLFRVGKGTSVELADTEANLVRARFAAISARIDQRIARVHVEHATGRGVARSAS
jgi:outer membrane protein TolC